MEECAQCGKRGDTNAIRCCSQCKTIRYCSRDCQTRHWPQHRDTCTPTADHAASSSCSARTETDQRRPTTTGKKQPLSTEQEANSEANLPAGSNCPGPWQQAKSKALAAFPGNRAIDSFDDLELTEKFCFESPIPFTIIPSEPDQLKVDSIVEGKTAGIVMVMKLVSPFFNPWRHHWIVEDRTETSAHVRFLTPGLPVSHFRYEDLQRGHFLCARHVRIELFRCDVHIIHVQDVSSVRIFRTEELACAYCGKSDSSQTIRLCTGCKAIRYCSRDCQKRHWSQHKAICKSTKHDSLHGDSSGDNKDQIATGSTGGEDAVKGDGENTNSGPLMTCKKCGRRSRQIKRCGRCGQVTYCSRDCQRGDWQAHKVTCRAVDVITTDGHPQLEEREQTEREKEREQPLRSRRPDPLSSLLRLTPQLTLGLTWAEARSRAQRLYPRSQIVDKFKELKNDMMFTPNAKRVVAVVRLKGPYPHPYRQGRCLQDSEGLMSYVLFHNRGDPMPYFRYDQLRDGNFLCYERAFIHVFADVTIGFRIDDPKDVHIMEP